MEIKITGKKIFWGIVIILIIAAAAVWAWKEMASAQDPNGPSAYSAVYLTSGDVYFGKLSWFPTPHMTDVWYLNRSTTQSGQSQLAVAPLKNVFWGPVDEVNFNPAQILFWTSLSNGSQLVKGFENPSSLQNAPAPASSDSGTSSSSAGAPQAPTSTDQATSGASAK